MADAIFISYRRDDAEGEAGRLFDDLTRAFGNDAVFMDVAGIKPGVDFRKAIEQNVSGCGVLLAIIGPAWASIVNADGKRRLEDPSDFVALEIASALRREVPVIPVLVHEAKMPAPAMLPASLADLAFRNSVEISHARWSSDVALLIEALKSYVTPKPSASEATVHATVPVQLPAPHPPSGASLPATEKSRIPIPVIAGAIVVAVLAVAAFAYVHSRPSPTPVAASAPVDHTTTPAAAPVPEPVQAPDPAPAQTPAQTPGPIARTGGAPAGGPAAAAYDGTWVRPGTPPVANSLYKLIISGSGGSITVRAFGNCPDPVCDWGTQSGVLDGGNVIATFTLPAGVGQDTRTAMVTAHTVPEGLDVFVHNTYQGTTSLPAKNIHLVLVSAP